MTYKTTQSHCPHLRCSSVCVSGSVSEDAGALGRALPAIALLSHTKPISLRCLFTIAPSAPIVTSVLYSVARLNSPSRS